LSTIAAIIAATIAATYSNIRDGMIYEPLTKHTRTVVRSRRAQGVIGSLRNYRAEMKRRPRHRRQTITRIPRAAA
jgi:hypothetical protein